LSGAFTNKNSAAGRFGVSIQSRIVAAPYSGPATQKSSPLSEERDLHLGTHSAPAGWVSFFMLPRQDALGCAASGLGLYKWSKSLQLRIVRKLRAIASPKPRCACPTLPITPWC